MFKKKHIDKLDKRMLLRKYIFLACGISVPVIAQEVQDAKKIWRGLDFGISEKEFREKQPVLEVEMGSTCKAKISPRFRNGLLYGIILDVKPIGKDGLEARKKCSQITEAGLTKKYGNPIDVEAKAPLGLPASANISLFWRDGSVVIRHSFAPLFNATTVSYTWVPASPPIEDVSGKM